MVYRNILSRIFLSSLLLLIYFISLTNDYLLFVLATTIYIIIIYETYLSFKYLYKIIIFYLIFSYLCFVLFFLNFFDFFLLNIMIFSIIIFDSFSYFSGKLFGKIFVFKKISPKKTLEGYVGGFFFTNFSFLIYVIFIQIDFKFINLFLLINIIIFFSIIGDLIQSYFKRKNNLKDSSSYLLGHGGFFDRFDGFIASIIFLLFYNIIYI